MGYLSYALKYVCGPDAGFINIIKSTLSGKDKGRINSPIDAAGYICIKAIAYYQCIFRFKSKPLHCKIYHPWLGFTHELRLPAGGFFQHESKGTAVGDITVFRRAHPVGIGGKIVHPSAQKDAGILKFGKGQLPVKANNQNVYVVLQAACYIESRRLHLFLK